MDEITEVREMRADAPAPDAARLMPGRLRLREAAAKRSSARRLRVDRRITVVGAAAAVAVAVLAGTQLAGAGADGGPAAPAASRVQQTPDLTDAPALLRRAADAAAAQPDPAPQAGQWVYRETVRGHESGPPPEPSRQEEWHPYIDPAFENGKEGDDHSHRERYEFLAGLPADPDRLFEKAREFYPSGDGPEEPRAEHDYRAARVILSTYPAHPEGLARVYRALATVDGMKAVDHLVEDATGRRVVALYRDDDAGTRDEILLDPETFAYRGSRVVVTGEGQPFGGGDGGPAGQGPEYEKGDILINQAVVRTGLVARDGRRP